MLGLQYKLCYKKGVENKAADALSRVQPQDHLEVPAISTSQSQWLEDISQGYLKFPNTIALLASLAVQNPCGDYMLKDGIIRGSWCHLIPVPNTKLLRLSIVVLCVGGGAFWVSCYLPKDRTVVPLDQPQQNGEDFCCLLSNMPTS